MTSAKCSDFFTPTLSLILFLSSAFRGPPPSPPPMSHCRHHLRMLPIKLNNSRFPSPCGHDLFLIRIPISHNAAVWPFSDLRHARQFSPLCNCTSHDVEVSFIGGVSTFQLQISNFMITKAICIYCECNEARSL